MPELSWRKSAHKQLRAITHADDRKKLNDQINELKNFPLVPPNLDVTTLKNGQADYRLRWGFIGFCLIIREIENLKSLPSRKFYGVVHELIVIENGRSDFPIITLRILNRKPST